MKLKKELGFLDLFSIASGAMISSGLFILPGTVFAKAGPAIIFSYILAGLLMIPSILSKVELATAMPKSGGTYFYIERSLGPLAGVLSGLSNWFSIALKSAFALIGIGAFMQILYPEVTYFQIKLIAVGFCFLFMIINLVSVKKTGRFQIILVIGLLITLFIYAITGINSINIKNYIPFNPVGFKAILSTTGMIFISYGGITKIASISEEVKNPGKNIPFSMISAFIVVSFLYIFVVGITVGLVNPDLLKGSLMPISLGAAVFAGKWGALIMAIAGLTAYITTANAGILASSRSPMAMSIDNYLPPFFSRIHKKFKTPHLSILITSLIIMLLILFLNLENLVKLASTHMLLLFIFANISIIIMRESNIKSYRPKFKSPFYPFLQIFAIISYLFIITQMGELPLLLTLLFLLGGSSWYWIYVKDKTVKRDYAIIHLVERITAKEFIDTRLENELRDILWARDEINEDRFDKLIKKAEILDLRNKMDHVGFFRIISKMLDKELNIKPVILHKLFLQREKESSTVIKEGLAIPHIIIEGKKKFLILLARSKKGIKFPLQKKPVKIIFILIGSKDERNFHLKALMSIAQIVQEKDFCNDWLNAKNLTQLKNTILLAKRDREKR